eukprot:5062734-Prymnesium_polylepis.1
MKSRQELWRDSSGVATGVKDRSRISAISWIDQSLGVLCDFLTERGVKDSTIIVVLSDKYAIPDRTPKRTVAFIASFYPLSLWFPIVAAARRKAPCSSRVCAPSKMCATLWPSPVEPLSASGSRTSISRRRCSL